MGDQKLNVDIAGSIAKLDAMLKEFKLKQDIFKIMFRGKGLEFDGYRDFSPDDDAQDIDWKASSRSGRTIVKRYKEERDLKIMFLVDVGSNMVFGSTPKIKCEYATELTAAFAHILVNTNDKIAFTLFSNKIKEYSDFRSGFKHFNRFTDLLKDGKNYGGKSNINMAIDYAMEYLDDSIMGVIIISDFLSANEGTLERLNLLSNRFETITIRVRDPLDLTLPDIEGEILIEDPRTHEQVLINPKVARSKYEKYTFKQGVMVENMFKKCDLDYLDLTTDKDFVTELAIFLKERLLKK
jgi:uncharacterized protein (DUF58 family)